MDYHTSAARFIPIRPGSRSTAAAVLAKHKSSYSARVADRVVHACAWSNGALDVVFGDGTVLSFADHMNTFVAFSPPGTHAANRAEPERDMQYTRWALSKYRTKVAAALGCYNHYSAAPRLFAEHMDPAQIHVWPHSGPVEALVLAHDTSLLERRRVFEPVIASAEDTREAATSSSPLVVPPSLPLSQVELLAATLDRDRAVAEVCVGVEVTLWCALHRVSLTIEPRGRAFTVRWPAPLSAPPQTPLPSQRWSSADIIARHGGHTHVVWIEQCFPVCAAPEPWAPMLALALALHAAHPLKSTDDGDDVLAAPGDHTCPSTPLPSSAAGEHQLAVVANDERAVSYHALPVPLSNDSRRSPTCGALFSSMQPQHAHLLRAASLHQRGDWQWQREVHGPTCAVLWRLDLDPAADSPPAIYWCISPTSASESSCGGVCAVVREDASVVSVYAHGSGYAVEHATIDGRLHSYHVQPDGMTGLPPVVGALAFAEFRLVPSRIAHDVNLEDVRGSAVLANTPSSRFVRRRALAFPSAVKGRSGHAHADGLSSGTSGEPEDLEDEEEERALFWARRSGYGAGHYLKGVGRVCVELAQWALSAVRAAETTSSVAMLTDHPTDGSLFRHFLTSSPQSNALSMASNPCNSSVLFLTTRLDGIGNFTALANGVIRCSFDDRTLVTLIPGQNAFDESSLAASCLFRDATRCTMRVSQCRDPTHPLYRYIAYALPFRRYVMMEAAARRDGCISQEQANAWCELDTSFHVAQDNSGAAKRLAPGSALSTCDVNRSASLCQRSSVDGPAGSSLASSLLATQLRGGDNAINEEAEQMPPPLDLYLTTLDETMEQQRWHDLSGFQATDQRVQSLLDESDQLRRQSEALLSERE